VGFTKRPTKPYYISVGSSFAAGEVRMLYPGKSDIDLHYQSKAGKSKSCRFMSKPTENTIPVKFKLSPVSDELYALYHMDHGTEHLLKD
jgi:hypothetical protein